MNGFIEGRNASISVLEPHKLIGGDEMGKGG